MNDKKDTTKFVKILTDYLPDFDISTVVEVIYDKETRKVLEENICGCYKGKRDLRMTWNFYSIHLDVDGKDPEIYYPTEEQYINNWTLSYEIKTFLSCTPDPY